MERDAHEAILADLLNPETEHSRRTELLQQLRTDYDGVLNEYTEHTTKLKKLSDDNADLILSNSKLFRQIGVTGQAEEKEVEKKEFSETVRISDFEKE